VLYRSNHQARVMEKFLRNQKIPYTISGGQSFFDKTEIKDITSYLRLIANEDDDRNTNWPRIRSTLYQAYVGRLGWLGAELARQVASIYGQASDYASYYNNLNDNNASSAMPKRQALQLLVF
jgi:superfamily I DNA/RNA helicase